MVASGSRLGPYEIVSRIGAGGMGEVWQARDTRLERSVAIKILPAEFAQNAQLKLRFEREAKTISQLNHPNICTLYDVGDDYLVMELLDGESLADRLARGPLPLDQVLRYGAEIADALDRAHRAGIVHRDLKPGNVMLTKSGAKLLDFGLAKSAAAPVTQFSGVTEQKPLTQEGTILGTFQYMAPEQLEGEDADARTDIFALGALLYEMATGKRAFEGKTRTSLIAAIVGAQPRPIRELQPLTPPAFEHVVAKCLAKDRDGRWQSAHDVAAELRWIAESGSQAGVAPLVVAKRRLRERLAWALHLLTALVAVGLTWLFIESRKPPVRLIETSIVPPDGWQFDRDRANIAVSPDGATIAFLGHDAKRNSAIFLRPLESHVALQLPGTDAATYPFWSPDGRQLGFFADGKLKVIEIATGATRTLADAPLARGGSWSSAGTIVFAPTAAGPIFAIDSAGGTASAVTRLGPHDNAHLVPVFLGDGRHFVYLAAGSDPAIAAGSIDGTVSKRLIPWTTFPGYSPPGLLLLWRDGTLFAQRIDEKTLQLRGSLVPVAQEVGVLGRRAMFAASRSVLVCVRGAAFTPSQLVWVDRKGKDVGALAPPGLFFTPRLSHDGRRVAVDISAADTGFGDIWVFDLQRQAPTRLTFSLENDSGPVWSADDKEITYFSGRSVTAMASAGANLYRIAAGGTGEERPLVENEAHKLPADASRDGRWLVFVSDAFRGRQGDLWLYSERDRTTMPWLATPFAESAPALSPDGRWMAYQSNESGRNEVYVRSFPDAREKWLVSTGGGTMPAWRGDGRELYYIAPPSTMTAVPITAAPSFNAGTPAPLFESLVVGHNYLRQYDVTADGSRFLINRRGEDKQEPLTVIQNWQTKVTP